MREERAYNALPSRAPLGHPEFVIELLRTFILRITLVTMGNQDIDWQWLEMFATTYSLGPLFLHFLPLSAIPPPLIERWKRDQSETNARAAKAVAVAERIFEVAERRKIALAVVRGLIFDQAQWIDPALYPKTPLDILVEKQSLPVLMPALQKQGIISNTVHRGQAAYELDGIPVEFHWSMLPKGVSAAGDTGALLALRRPVILQQRQIYHLPAEVTLAINAAHLLTRHELNDLGGLIEIALNMQHGTVDWGWIASWCTRTHLSGITVFPLMFTNQLFSLGKEQEIARITAQILRPNPKATAAYRAQLFGDDSFDRFYWRQYGLYSLLGTRNQRFHQFLRFFATTSRRRKNRKN